MCMCVSTLGGGQSVPNLPPGRSLHFLFDGAAKGECGCWISSDSSLCRATKCLLLERAGSVRRVPERHRQRSDAFSRGFMLTEIWLHVAPSPAPGRENREGNGFFRAWALLSKACCAKPVHVEFLSVQGNWSISAPSSGLRTGTIFEAPPLYPPSRKLQGFPPPPNACRRSCQTVQISPFPVCWWAADLSVTDMTR